MVAGIKTAALAGGRGAPKEQCHSMSNRPNWYLDTNNGQQGLGL